LIELYRAKSNDKTVKYHFYYYTIYIDNEPAFEIELAEHKEVHVISDSSIFNLGVDNYRKVSFEKSDLVKYGNERDIIWQYFGRIGE